MTSRKTVWIAYVGVLATLLFSLLSLKARYHVESRNKATELAVELDAIEALAAAQKLTLGEALTQLKTEGVSSVVLSEQTVGELISEGRLEMREGETPEEIRLYGSEQSIARVKRGYHIRFLNGSEESPDGAQKGFFIKGRSPTLIRSLAVGLDPVMVNLAQEADLRIIARADNPDGSDSGTVKETLHWFREDGASIFLPQGDQVLGRHDNLDALNVGLIAENMLYASPEFAKLGGDINVLQKAPERIVRLHSAQTAELDKMSLAEAVDRYVRAASERSMRILLIRPFSYSSASPFDDYKTFITKIRKKMEGEGVVTGRSHPFEEPEVARWVFPAIGLSASIVAVCAASLFFTGPVLLSLIGLLSVAAGLGAFVPELRSYAALMAAIAFPVAAYGFLEAHRHRIIVLHYVLMTLVCLVGGLAVAGLLNALPYFIRAEQFEGVKLAHFGPILLIGLYMAMRLIDWRGGLKNPITWLQAILSLVLLAGLAVMFIRTGNDNPAAVSGFEIKLRGLLENILPTRPRTKEFMIGYPALIVGLGLLMLVRKGGNDSLKGWAVLALMVGAIALTSVVNTMCHIHTPLSVGLIRIAVGFALGGIIGAGAWMVLRYFLPKAEA